MDKEADCARGVADEHSAREAKERDAREAERPRGEITNVIHQVRMTPLCQPVILINVTSSSAKD